MTERPSTLSRCTIDGCTNPATHERVGLCETHFRHRRAAQNRASYWAARALELRTRATQTRDPQDAATVQHRYADAVRRQQTETAAPGESYLPHHLQMIQKHLQITVTL